MSTPPDSAERVAQFFRSFTVLELADWIRTRLYGLDEIGGAAYEEPHELIADVHARVEEAVCVNMQKAVHVLVEDLATNPETWPLAAAVNLLMLMDPVLVGSPRSLELTDLLLLLLEPKTDVHVDPHLKFSAAQAILTLDAKASPAFWQSLYKDASYAPIVVEGLLRTDVNGLLAWWPKDHPDPALEEAFINLIPFIISGPGSGVAADLIRTLTPLFSPASQRTVFRVAEALGIGESARPTVDLRVVNTLIGTLQLVVKLLCDSDAVPVAETFVGSFRANLAAVRETLQRHTHLVSAADALEALWRTYVNCIDHALAHPQLAAVCVRELMVILSAPLLETVLIHLLEDRALDKTSLLEILHDSGAIDLEVSIAPIVPSDRILPAPGLPADLRDQVIVELSRREEERHARDELLEMEAEMGWEAFR